MPRKKAVTLGQAVDICLNKSQHMWTREFANGREVEAFLALEMVSMTATLVKGPSGQVHVYIEYTARQPYQCGTYIFRLVRETEGRYVPQVQRLT